METIFCLALLAAVAVIGIRGEACNGTDISTCTHEHCSGSANGVLYTLVCYNDTCTCEVKGQPCDPSNPDCSHCATDPHSPDCHHPICLSTADCHQHCPDQGHGQGGVHGHVVYQHVECVNGRCHCRH